MPATTLSSSSLAVRHALAVGAGHSFLVLLREGFPVNVLNQVNAIVEVCRVYCATANPVQVLVAETDRGVVGVVDGDSGRRWTSTTRSTSGTAGRYCDSAAVKLDPAGQAAVRPRRWPAVSDTGHRLAGRADRVERAAQ